MKTPAPPVRIHVTHYCQILVVSSTPTTIGMMKHLASMAPPAEMNRGIAGDTTPFKIILSGFDPFIVDLVKQAREAEHPASLVIVDMQCSSDWESEQLISALLSADSMLHILLLKPCLAPLSPRLITFLSRCNRMAMLKTPCDEIELGQLVRVMLAKWLSEISDASASASQVADAFATSDAMTTAPHDSPAFASAPTASSPSGQSSTVLVVEDDETVLWMMEKVLETHHFRVITATNAEDAWKKWRENVNTIKLVISDINMPGGPNGVALGHAIQDEDGSVPVIYTSGNRAVQEFTELRVGTNYLVKPFRMDDLLEIVDRALATQSQLASGLSSRLVEWRNPPSHAAHARETNATVLTH